VVVAFWVLVVASKDSAGLKVYVGGPTGERGRPDQDLQKASIPPCCTPPWAVVIVLLLLTYRSPVLWAAADLVRGAWR